MPANRPSISPVLNSFPTNLLRYLGFTSSPLLISIHLVFMIFQPLRTAWLLGILLYTRMSRTYCISLPLASMTLPASSSIPVRSSNASCDETPPLLSLCCVRRLRLAVEPFESIPEPPLEVGTGSELVALSFLRSSSWASSFRMSAGMSISSFS